MRAEIRTSDRGLFKRCRRKWNWQSGLREGRKTLESAAPLWLGTGFHYALEDFHGYNVYGDPEKAFMAYVEACRRTPRFRMPEGWEENAAMGRSMAHYYFRYWLEGRDPLDTLWVDGVPQCEVYWEIPFPPEIQEIAKKNGYDEGVVYRGTFDRIIMDNEGRLWIVEFKTAKSMRHLHFMHDAQCSAYMWAAQWVYNIQKGIDAPIAGVIYQQHFKGQVSQPLFLKDGSLSVNKQQGTSHRLYRAALIELYGVVDKAPTKNVDFLNYLATQESEDYDPAVRRDRVYRNEHQIAAEAKKILQEVPEMLNRELPLYPNPTRDCQWDCPFEAACVSMDDGGDYELEVENIAPLRTDNDNDDRWKNYLPRPEDIQDVSLEGN